MTFPIGLKVKCGKWPEDIDKLPRIYSKLDLYPMCECGDPWKDHTFKDGEFYCSTDETMMLLEYNDITPETGD